MKRVDKGQLYFSVVVVLALGWEKEEDYEAKFFFGRKS